VWSSRSVTRQNVRREALLVRMEVKDRHRPAVVAVGCSWRQPCDVMSHVMSDHVDWRSVSEDVIRSSVRGTVPVLACVVGNCGVRSPG
jgi:hypothetical protein